jgi:uncharacterized protein DUF3306
MSEGGEGFLSRWSRRKRAATVAPPAEPPAAAPVPPEAAPPQAEAPPGGAPPAFDPASLPPVGSLTAESDFAAFLRDEVPAALRRAALRRAWTLDPAIRDFVGPADYAWDYNAPDGVPGFSFNLTGDLERLVAQAIGSAPPVAEEGAPGEAPPPAEAAAAPPSSEPAAPEPTSRETSSAEAAAQEEPAPEALPAPAAAPVADASPVRRRHGGAVPS